MPSIFEEAAPGRGNTREAFFGREPRYYRERHRTAEQQAVVRRQLVHSTHAHATEPAAAVRFFVDFWFSCAARPRLPSYACESDQIEPRIGAFIYRTITMRRVNTPPT